MKLRLIAIIFAMLIIAYMLVSLSTISSQSGAPIDMVAVNESMHEILKKLGAGADRASVEKDNNCIIALRTDSSYERTVMSAIKERSIVMDYTDGDFLLGKIILDGDNEHLALLYDMLAEQLITMCLVLLGGGFALLAYIYLRFLRPFKLLQGFAADVAKGNLDAPLAMQRHNFFGAFTESFDLMREELKKARENEYLANVSKKELVAELSHDMKTPIATIKATCDVLRVQVERGMMQELRVTTTADDVSCINDNPTTGRISHGMSSALEKLNIIEQKTDMIDRLISNMFHASLEELEALKVTPEAVPATDITAIFDELRYAGDIQLISAPPEYMVLMDKLRLQQVIDNIINNSIKYAGTRIEVSFIEENGIIIEIRDFGPGVKDDELPLVTEKFYRGENGNGRQGAGLGLYLSKYFMQNMNGDMECHNDGGFVVSLYLRKA